MKPIWQCPYCGVKSYISDSLRRRVAIANHLKNNHADALNNFGSNQSNDLHTTLGDQIEQCKGVLK